MYEKVGRLKPDPVRDGIRIIVDGLCEVGIISRSEIERVFRFRDPGKVDPDGTATLSASGDGFLVMIPGTDGGRFVAVVRQVLHMLEVWPNKKQRCLRRKGKLLRIL